VPIPPRRKGPTYFSIREAGQVNAPSDGRSKGFWEVYEPIQKDRGDCYSDRGRIPEKFIEGLTRLTAIQFQGFSPIGVDDSSRDVDPLETNKQFVNTLNRLAEVNKHNVPDGNGMKLLKNAMAFELKHRDPIEKAKRARKIKTETKPHSRSIPAGIQYQEAARAKHQCVYISPDGTRCTERAGLENDHVESWAVRGTSNDLRNIQLLCWAITNGRLDWNLRKTTARILSAIL
jgi:hypothetical protein